MEAEVKAEMKKDTKEREQSYKQRQSQNDRYRQQEDECCLWFMVMINVKICFKLVNQLWSNDSLNGLELYKTQVFGGTVLIFINLA